MWSIFPAAAILLAQAQPAPAEKWCFERGQRGAQLCEDNESACNDLLKINTEIATGPCLRVEPKVEQSGSTARPASTEKQTPTKGKPGDH
jgi:hypothetical protein